MTSFLTIFLCFTFLQNAFAQTSYNEGLYFKEKIKVTQAAKLIKGKKLKTSYIVVLDGGIDKAYFDQWYGKLIKDAIYFPDWGSYFGDPFSDYYTENPHGTNVQWISDEITYSVGVNDFKTIIRSKQFNIKYAMLKVILQQTVSFLL